MIWTSNLSLKACCCYRRRLFLLRIFGIYVPTYVYHLGYIYIIYAFMFSLANISGTCAQRKGISSIFKKKHQFVMFICGNIVMSRAIYPYLVTRGRCKTRHMGRSKCNRSFHSQDVSQPQIGGSFWKKKRSCVCVNLII